MARIDKVTHSFRVPAGTALTGVQAVKLTGGSAVPSGSADAVGVTCYPGTIAAGRICSVLTRAEIVEFGGSAGSLYYAEAGGTVGLTAGGTLVGPVADSGDRLIVLM